MKPEAALKAALEVEGLSDDVKAVLSTLAESGVVTDDAANARAAADRRKAERKHAEALERIAELESRLEETQEQGGTELEKAQREAEKLAKKLEAAEKKANEASEALNSQARTIALGSVKSQINFAEGISPEIQELMLEKAFNGVDTDDLKDPSVVNPLIQDFISNNKAIVVKHQSGGAGTHSGNAEGSATTGKITREIVKQKSAEGDAAWFKENEAALVEAQARGEI